MGIYVETFVQGSLHDLWKKTQTPELHERWDARFTSITYLHRASESQPQRFRYSTRMAFGLCVDGEGETVGSRDDAGRRTSSLRFWSNDIKSLIREGAGYWQYIPVDDGVRFITGYDYQTRFGWVGRIFDRFVFRPLMGWATAWSFDRLRLWIEKDIDPAVTMQRTVVHFICRITLAAVWIYQGLIPKLIARHPDELEMLADAGIADGVAPTMLAIIGCVEIVWGGAVLFFCKRRWPLMITVLLMILATIAVALSSPDFLSAAFNPVTLNLLVAVVSLIGLAVMKDLPSAGRCLRAKPEVG
ncbi:hypothetical protein Fuma_05700 [Fuerstiella marisgermanici]|uniref:DoxX-like family protein n=2 Tax=Fuerstiella marisgermanici TaxID=1891926 RepID=A0A1P8WPQ5_9PLAN|nr:hypothetical protein Fuma_05700 [Fuerstiella marisgermanici]